MTTFKHILVPIDLDLDSTSILELAGQVAASFGARLELVHVFETDGYEGPMHLEAANLRDPALKGAHEPWRTAMTMLGHLKRLEERGLTASGRMAFGTAEETLAELARKEGFDLIVVGTRGLEGLDRFLSGSVAEGLIRLAPCPVLVIPHVPERQP